MDDSLIDVLAPELAAFEAVATRAHVTRAAEQLGVPQSSVSRRLRNLERELGVALVRPDGRGIALTPMGSDLLDRIRGPLRLLDAALTAVRVDSDQDHGLVRFGFPFSLGPVSVPKVLSRFHDEAPGIRLRLVQAHGAGLVAMLRSGELDLAIAIPAPVGIAVVKLGTQPMRVCVSRGHRLAGRSHVRFAELVDEIFVANPREFHLRSVLETWCEEAGFEPRVALEITELETLRELVALDLGIAVLPPGEVPRPDIMEIPLTDGKYERSIGLATPNGDLTPAARRLHRFLESASPWGKSESALARDLR